MPMQGIGFYDTDFPVIKRDRDLIMENVRRVLLTIPGECVGNLEFGCRLREYVFEFDNVLEEDLEQEIITAINRWEPRVVIIDVNLEKDPEMQEKFRIKMNLALRETYEKFYMQIPIEF